MRKYIFVTGGAVSDSAKTTVAASIGLLLSARGFKVLNKKLNPCMNVNLGALNPALCGETFITSDGADGDLSLGFYERFSGCKAKKSSFITAGNVYWSVINKERMGSFLGNVVTVSAHVADEIKNFVFDDDADVIITEVGGTVGDVESAHFLDAIGKVKETVADENVMYVHVENIPHLAEAEEEKLAPLSRSISALLERGIQPDAVVCRTEEPMEDSMADKISIFCNLHRTAVVECQRADILYETPLILEKNGLSSVILRRLSLQDFKPKLDLWKEFVQKAKKAEKEVKIALVGKYASLHGAYQSTQEALECAASVNDVRLQIDWIDSELINERNASVILSGADGIILPDGRGRKGTEGMICAAAFAREKDIPFLAIGQGMHMAVVELATNALGLKGAHSQEICQTAYPVITETEAYSGEKRIKIIRGTKTFSSYGRELFSERCRHKYIVSSAYKDKLEEAGIYFVGKTEDSGDCEIVEMPEKRFYIGVQFNPEFSSSPINVHPLFKEFVHESSK